MYGLVQPQGIILFPPIAQLPLARSPTVRACKPTAPERQPTTPIAPTATPIAPTATATGPQPTATGGQSSRITDYRIQSVQVTDHGPQAKINPTTPSCHKKKHEERKSPPPRDSFISTVIIRLDQSCLEASHPSPPNNKPKTFYACRRLQSQPRPSPGV